MYYVFVLVKNYYLKTRPLKLHVTSDLWDNYRPLRQVLFVFVLNWVNCPQRKALGTVAVACTEGIGGGLLERRERVRVRTCGEKRSKLKLTCACHAGFFRWGIKRSRIGGVDLNARPLETRISHMRDCSLTPFKIAQPTFYWERSGEKLRSSNIMRIRIHGDCVSVPSPFD